MLTIHNFPSDLSSRRIFARVRSESKDGSSEEQMITSNALLLNPWLDGSLSIARVLNSTRLVKLPRRCSALLDSASVGLENM